MTWWPRFSTARKKMPKQTGKLLSRNEGSATAPRPSTTSSNGHIDSSLYDSLSENFVIPPGIPSTPRGLAIFFTQELRKHYGYTGENWMSLYNYRAHLRPARRLLEDVGFENSIRIIVYAVRVAAHIPSFKFVLQCAERFKSCPEIGLLT